MDKSNGGPDTCPRWAGRTAHKAGEALAPFDVARSSKRTDEQELRVHGDEAEGGSQGSGAAEQCRRGEGVSYPDLVTRQTYSSNYPSPAFSNQSSADQGENGTAHPA